MYVATKGGAEAIRNAHRLLELQGRPRTGSDAIDPRQVADQLWFAVSRVMAEGSVYDPSLAALAVLQAQGDLGEAVFLVRAYRATVPRIAVSVPIDTDAMRVKRRVSATFKDVPGGQILGPTSDYSHRLIDFGREQRASSLGREGEPDLASEPIAVAEPGTAQAESESPPAVGLDLARVLDVLDREGLIEQNPESHGDRLTGDLTREPLSFPASRPLRLQALARGDDGFLLGLAYSTQRGYGSTHPFVGEIRMGMVDVEVVPDELDFPVVVGEIEVTECEMINQFRGSGEAPPQFTRGYGLSFGQGERRTMAMALLDRAMRTDELEGPGTAEAPAQDVEFVLSHADHLEASGFVQHLKLPHYVDFQSELVLVRGLRSEWEKAAAELAERPSEPGKWA